MRETAESSVAQQLETLRSERDALLQNDISTWLSFVKTEATSLRDFQNSLSWKVTKPLRVAGTFSRTAQESGLPAAFALSFNAVKKRVRGQ